ncbi:MAG: transglycosylase SLT domain-containing protein [Candidatus Poribacteria bacterium]|nr:transglycosylase SLT domain-containing protein [Candidatus Poribacteria bacterium]
MLRKRTLFFLILILVLIVLLSAVMSVPSDLRLLVLTPKMLKYRGLIQQHAVKQGLDARLVCALIVQESGFDENAQSPVGAQGLTQLMPKTAEELGVQDPLDAAQNIAGAARHLRNLYRAFPQSPHEHRHRLVLASYNGGLGRVRDAQALVRHHKVGNPILWEPVSRTLSQLTQKHTHLHSEVWENGKPPHGYFEGFNETLDYVERVMHYYERICFYDKLLFFL